MDTQIKTRFIDKWDKYFPGAELPIVFYYTDTEDSKSLPAPPKGHRCLICDLTKVRRGKDLCLNVDSIGCGGGRRYLGFAEAPMPNFEYFLSYGIQGKMEGERYKKSPELVRKHMKRQTSFKAPARYISFKRWDRIQEGNLPSVIIFFVPPDVLSGLFTLANFDQPEPHGVIAPFASGCASIVDYPYKGLHATRPRAVLGMFDVSARPFVPAGLLTFSVPWTKFVCMLDDMDESFLITQSWGKVKNRIRRNVAK
ncbi:MAG: DUF169 domain-containing protein [Syntrophales bacterium]